MDRRNFLKGIFGLVGLAATAKIPIVSMIADRVNHAFWIKVKINGQHYFIPIWE